MNTDIAKNDRWGANGSGIRVNTWGLLGGPSSFIVSDFADQYSPESGTGNPTNTDDAYIARLRRDLRDRSLRLGFGFNRRVEDQVNEFPEEASTYAFDSRYQWQGIDWSLEYAFAALADQLRPLRPSPTTGRGDLRTKHRGRARSGRCGWATRARVS